MARFKTDRRGWFGICPVFLSDPRRGPPFVIERHPALASLMIASEWGFAAFHWVQATLGFECSGFPMLITGELETPRYFDETGRPC